MSKIIYTIDTKHLKVGMLFVPNMNNDDQYRVDKITKTGKYELTILGSLVGSEKNVTFTFDAEGEIQVIPMSINQELEGVRLFHKTYNAPTLNVPTLAPKDRAELRVSLIQEELNEFKDAIADNDIVEVGDALVDLIYVVYGSVLEFGLGDKFRAMFDEVQASNMSKLDPKTKQPIIRDDGKVMKGSDYFKPNLKDIIEG